MRNRPPLVVLIGGTSGVGKSTIGQALAHRLGAASTSGDDLHLAIKALTTPETHPSLHPAHVGHIRYFTESSPERLVADAEALERAIWPAIDAVVRLHLLRASPVVIDWWLLSPDTVAAITAPEVASIWLHLEPGALEARERSDTRWMEGADDPERLIANFLHRSSWRNDLVERRTDALGLPLVRLDGTEPVEAVVETCSEMLGV